jgi:hypothetical protein
VVAGNPPDPGSGYTTLAGVSFGFSDSQYKIVSVAQSSVAPAFAAADNGGVGWLMVADAIQKGSAGVTPHFFGFVPATVP